MGASASFAQTEPVDFLMPEVNSSLGQPIQAQVNLGQLDVRVGVVSAVLGDEESFAAFGVQRYQVLDAISLDLSNNAAGDFILKVFTDQPVYEPSLRFVVDLEDGSGLRQIPIELLLPLRRCHRARAPAVVESAQRHAVANCQSNERRFGDE